MLEIILSPYFLVFIYFWGKYLRKKQLKSFRQRSFRLKNITISNTKKLQSNYNESKLITASTVVSCDYLRRAIAIIFLIFGGRLKVYDDLLKRAKQEIELQIKEQVKVWGSTHCINYKIETVSVFSAKEKGYAGAIEVMAYATALK